MATTQFVFFYGSAVDLESASRTLGRPVQDARYHYGSLSNMVRAWDVALDSGVDIPGYKFYRHPDGTRYNGYVAFVNIRPFDGPQWTNGIFIECTEAEIARFDVRERSYVRTDVRDRVLREDTPRGIKGVDLGSGPVWTYIGSDEAKARFKAGKRQQRLVVHRGYYDMIHRAFRSLGDAQYSQFLVSTEEVAHLCEDLERVDIPA